MHIISAADFPLFCSNSARKCLILLAECSPQKSLILLEILPEEFIQAYPSLKKKNRQDGKYIIDRRRRQHPSRHWQSKTYNFLSALSKCFVIEKLNNWNNNYELSQIGFCCLT